ncbi:Protein MRG1 [Cocos nucifera]|uniref:Protein MRG1 n=1 Tax=Cocos nucifera TaxID=13894 RepID=A0A8K0IPV5_COCNU|nr:Protein MRG1 [Cocos nucifera]
MGSSNTTEGTGGANADPSASDSPAAGPFAEGEKVLAYHGPCIYEAKVQKAELRRDEWKYFVHYLVSYEIKCSLVSDHVLFHISQLVAKGKKRKALSGTEEKDAKSAEKHVMLQFPLTLKKQLVDDWEFVTQLGKLVKLPRSPNVDDILKKYLDYRTKKDGMNAFFLSLRYNFPSNWIAESVGEILKGVRCYFDKALPAMLLYKKERQQYQEAIHDNVSPSTVYGAEHLLRLFVKLPELLSFVNMEEEALAKLQQKLLDFLKYSFPS